MMQSSSHTKATTFATDNEALFKQLTTRPRVAWPTLVFCLFVLGGFAVTTYAGIQELIPEWLAFVLNSTFCFQAFTVVHDASHNAISLKKSVNDWTGRIASFILCPLIDLRVFRFIHMQHHRFANDPKKDPDYWVANGSPWTFLFRWGTLDISYAFYYCRSEIFHSRPASERKSQLITILVATATIAGLFAMGWGEQALLYWLLPSRIAVFLLALAFDFLPHYPQSALGAEDPYQASNNRVGFEWLLTPLLLGQNYHLSHHLYPTVPFYRYIAVWRAKEKSHLSHNPLTVKAFNLQPEPSNR